MVRLAGLIAIYISPRKIKTGVILNHKSIFGVISMVILCPLFVSFNTLNDIKKTNPASLIVSTLSITIKQADSLPQVSTCHSGKILCLRKFLKSVI